MSVIAWLRQLSFCPLQMEDTVITGKTLMLIAEIIAVTAVALQFFLPSEVGMTIHVGHRALGLPIRWVAPLLLISLSGALSVIALLVLYWQLARVAAPAVGQ
jgi:hypothetical protein